jgi:glucan-binding YG repeat protein
METGWVKDDGKWYYLNSDGAMRTGWLTLNGKHYYLDSNGAMLTGKHTVPCVFNSDGELI